MMNGQQWEIVCLVNKPSDPDSWVNKTSSVAVVGTDCCPTTSIFATMKLQIGWARTEYIHKIAAMIATIELQIGGAKSGYSNIKTSVVVTINSTVTIA